jgi:transposase
MGSLRAGAAAPGLAGRERRALPADYPPAWTVYYWTAKWQADDSTETMHGQLRDRVRQVAGRKPAPTAAIIDSQSVRASEEVAQAGRDYERLPAHHETYVYSAMIIVMTRRLARKTQSTAEPLVT